MKTLCKPLALFQETRFCDYAKQRVAEKFKGAVLCESFKDHEEAKAMAGKCPQSVSIVLVWGDGANHHHSNALNLAGSVKHVFDNHGDASDSARLGFESHNFHSRQDGVILRVCHSLGRRMGYFYYDGKTGNGTLHASVDLDFVDGFPSLPWMSVGANRYDDLLIHVKTLMAVHATHRLDMGGYHEQGNPPEKEMAFVYARYYEKLIEAGMPHA